MAFDTADNIINDAARELALIPAPITDPFASVDTNIVQLRVLLSGLGQDLLRDYDWTHLQKEYMFPTVNLTASYALPTDFARILRNTEWNRSAVQMLSGPATPAQWQNLKAHTASPLTSKAFRFSGNLLYLYPTPSGAEDVYFEYVSRYWVQPTGQAAPTTEACTAYTDTLWFDRRVLVLGLKCAFLRAKGFDSSAAQQDFILALGRAIGADGSAPVLRVTRAVNDLCEPALPPTGWGL